MGWATLEENVPVTMTEYDVAVEVAPSSGIYADGVSTSVITATVTFSGSVQSGQTVSFYTARGVLSSETGTTNALGVVTTTLTAPLSSEDTSALVTASRNGAQDEIVVYYIGSYALTVNVTGNGAVAKSPDQPGYQYNDVVTLPATADPGWTFDSWSGDLVSTTNPMTITMTANKTVTATFIPTVDFSSATYNVGEGAGSAVITVTLSAASGLTATVDYATSDGTAVAGDDHTAISGTLTFTPGVTSQTFAIAISDDTSDEDSETVTLDLSNASNANIGGNDSATLTIVDGDNPPTISISDVTVTEGDTGITNAVFTVSLSAARAKAISVEYATADGTAEAGDDYTVIFTTALNFPAGTTEQTITVQVKSDTVDESDETFFIDLNNPTNATIADNQGTGTITDDDTSAPGGSSVYLPIIICNY